MHIADEHIAEFQMLYWRHFSIKIEKEEALDKGIRLVRLMAIVTKHEAKRKQKEQYAPPL